MIQETPQAERFKQQLRDSLRRETFNSRAIRIAKHGHVYTCGDRDEMVGATRPRISKFMQRFRELGLIETTTERFLIIKEKRLTDYLAQIA